MYQVYADKVRERYYFSNSFEPGSLDPNDGTEINYNSGDDIGEIRSATKRYLKAGSIFKVPGYLFALYRYTDNTTDVSGYPESGGYVHAITSESEVFEIPTAGYYRIVLKKVSGAFVSDYFESEEEIQAAAEAIVAAGPEDSILIHDDTRNETTLKLISPKLTLEDSAAGSFTLTVPTENVGYDMIMRMTTVIRVMKDGNEIWEGRVIQEKTDFWNQRSMTCEGELAYLNDTTQPQQQYEYTGSNCVSRFLSELIAHHNAKADSDKQFEVGDVDVTSPINYIKRYTNYEKTIECINSKLIDQLGGHISISHPIQNGVRKRVLSYRESLINTNSQIIRFGKNLMDFTRSFDMTEYATVVVPLGKKLDDDELATRGITRVEGLEYYVTVEEVTEQQNEPFASIHTFGERFVKLPDAVSNYGWIEKVITFDDIDDPLALLENAELYLKNSQFENVVIELSAVDLHYLNPDIESVKIGDQIRVISEPHGINRLFPVQKMEIPLDDPENTKFTLGDTVKASLTAINNKVNTEVKDMLGQLPDIDTDAIIQQVDQNVSAIMNAKMNGYVSIITDEHDTHSEALYISEQLPTENAQHQISFGNRYWKWFMGGLGYTDDGGTTWKTAITMDGTIKGEYIAAGSIHGSKITAGSLKLVSEAQDEGCTLNLQATGLDKSDLEIGTITNGENDNSSYYARTKFKVPLKSGQKIKVTGCPYYVVRYTNNNTSSSGYIDTSLQIASGTQYTVPSDGYYRLKIYNNGSEVSGNDLSTMAANTEMGEGLVVSAATITFTGMVTFTSLDSYLGADQGRTIINGANIQAGSITADKISTFNLYVENVYYKDAYNAVHSILSSIGQYSQPLDTYYLQVNFCPIDHLIVGGSQYKTILNIFGDYINFKMPGDEPGSSGSLYIDMYEREIVPYNTGWKIGNSGNPFLYIYMENAICYGGLQFPYRSGQIAFINGNNTVSSIYTYYYSYDDEYRLGCSINGHNYRIDMTQID